MHVLSFGGCTIDAAHHLEDLGVTDVIVVLRNPYEPDTLGVEQKIDALRRFADEVIAKL
jgi:hypothetical protein